MLKKDRVSGFLVLAFLVLSLPMGGWSAYSALKKAGYPTHETGLNGKWALGYEKTFNEIVPIYQASMDAWGVLEYGLFKQGRKGVLIGQDGWLFTTEEVEHYKDHGKHIATHLDYIATVRDQLKTQNIELAVALVPAKARVYEDKLKPYAFPSYDRDTYQTVKETLRGKNITVVDIYSAMAGKPDMFLRTDTHWSPLGAKTAAEAIAGTIAPMLEAMSIEKIDFASKTDKTIPHSGDLLRYVPLGGLKKPVSEPDQLPVYTTEATTAVDPEAALLGDAVLPVTLIGTSYSANPLWNFAGFLKEALHADILNAADEGQGPFATMEAWLKSEALKDAPPKLVIWEIPERYLAAPFDKKSDKP